MNDSNTAPQLLKKFSLNCVDCQRLCTYLFTANLLLGRTLHLRFISLIWLCWLGYIAFLLNFFQIGEIDWLVVRPQLSKNKANNTATQEPPLKKGIVGSSLTQNASKHCLGQQIGYQTVSVGYLWWWLRLQYRSLDAVHSAMLSQIHIMQVCS